MHILGAMLRQGCAKKDFSYVCEIMQISLDENIKPNEIFLRHLHKFHLDCARAIDARVSTFPYHLIYNPFHFFTFPTASFNQNRSLQKRTQEIL